MEPVKPLRELELMDQILENLNSQDASTYRDALVQLANATLPRGSPYALPIIRRIIDLLELEALYDSPLVLRALETVYKGLENPEIIECIDRVLAWQIDPDFLLLDLIRSFAPTDGAAEYIISRIHLIKPEDALNLLYIDLISEKFRNHFTPWQIEQFLAHILTPEFLNAPPGPDGTINYDFDSIHENNTEAYRVFRAVAKLIPHLRSANWKIIGNCLFQLNYTPVEIVPLLYDKQPPQGVDVDALILACYEVASDFRSINGASYEALEVLMRRQTEMDDRLVGKIATLIEGNLRAGLANGVDIDKLFRVRDASAALVHEVLRLQTGKLWNTPLLRGLFEPFRVGREIGFERFIGVFRALMEFPDWPSELLREFISEIIRSVFVSFSNFPEQKQDAICFWERFCREYPAPEMELLDAFSEVAVAERAGLVGGWEALETILSSRAYQSASPGPDSLFWQRLRAKIEPFLDSDDPQKKSRACAVLAQYSS